MSLLKGSWINSAKKYKLNDNILHAELKDRKGNWIKNKYKINLKYTYYNDNGILRKGTKIVNDKICKDIVDYKNGKNVIDYKNDIINNSKHGNILKKIFDNFILNINEEDRIISTIETNIPPEWHSKHDVEKNIYYNPIICFSNKAIIDKIPKKIHKIFLNDIKENIPEIFYEKSINTWKFYYPDYEIIIYDKNDAINYIRNNYGEEFLYIYDLLIPYAFKADLLRLCILYNEGGIYTDLKQVLNRRLNEDFQNYSFVYSEETYIDWIPIKLNYPPIQNCFIACPPKHPYIKVFLDLIIQNILSERYGICCTDVTGPVVFGKAINIVKNKWINIDNSHELKLYFNIINRNKIPNIFSIDYNKDYLSETNIIVHKFDASGGAIWNEFNSNNNYAVLWAEGNIFNNKYNLIKNNIIKISKHEEILTKLFDNFVLNINEKDRIISTIETNIPPEWHSKHDIEKSIYYNPIICFSNKTIIDKIPKKIHKIFLNDMKQNIPEIFYEKAINTWKFYYPDYEIIIYDNNDAINYIRNNYDENFLYIYDLLIPYAFKADLLRLCILYNEGGIYTDLKQVLNRRLNEDFQNYSFVYSEENHVDWKNILKLNYIPIQNCFIACPPKHPYIKVFLDILIQNVLCERYGAWCTDVTGPIVFGKAMNIVKNNLINVNDLDELKLYFNKMNNNDKLFFTIDYSKQYNSNDNIIIHKFDNTTGANWTEFNNCNNNYEALWNISQIYSEKSTLMDNMNNIIFDNINILDNLKNFVLIVNSDCFHINNIIKYNKNHQTFISINDEDLDNINIIVNNNYKINKNNEINNIDNFIKIYANKISIIIVDYEEKYNLSYLDNVRIYTKYELYLKINSSMITKKDLCINLKSFKYNIKPYMIYFPQFHTIIENNINFYDDYNDIINLKLLNNSGIVKNETPLFDEYEINKLEDYNLTNINIIQMQIDILENYDLSGFAMYYYWFSTNTITNNNMIMEKCIDIFFSDKINIKNKKIFFIWANENWTNTIALSNNNTNNKIINEYTELNFHKNIDNLIHYFKNNNYLKIDNKPVFFIHHPFFMSNEELDLFSNMLNTKCIDEKFNGIYIVTNAIENKYSNYFNYYSNLNYKNTKYEYKYYDKTRKSNVIDYSQYILSDQHCRKDCINTIVYDFDNRARFFKPNKLQYSTYCINNTELDKIVFTKKIVETYNKNNKDEIENILLINAFNEWGEKMTFEPSNEYQYYNLNLLIDYLT